MHKWVDAGGDNMQKILFGAGTVGKACCQELFKGEVAFFCDSNLYGQVIENIAVISPEELKKIEKNYEIVVSVTEARALQEICEFLDCQGIPYKTVDEIKNTKHAEELEYWENRFHEEGEQFRNSFYKRLMLSMMQKRDDSFLKGKVVADFGCGPRGSLAWMESPQSKIGIDVLVPQYIDAFGETLKGHEMIYVTSTEHSIPLPSDYVDILFTINSLDHVKNLREMCDEICRVIKKGGILCGSFNLHEPETFCEPQTLSVELLNGILLDKFEIKSYRLARKGENETYIHMLNEEYLDTEINEPSLLWVWGVKR